MLTVKQILDGYTVSFRKSDGVAFYYKNWQLLTIPEEKKLLNK
jgi:hypothetical protein